MNNELNLNIPDTGKKRIVIVGLGFGGINLAKKIRKLNYQVVLFDRYNYHTFQPLLYQVATAGLEPDSIAGPIRKLIENYEDFHFRMLKVDKINLDEKTVSTMIGDISYDYLVISMGARTNYFGNENIRKNAFPLKQIPHALDLRSQIFQIFEKAILTRDNSELNALMNFVIVGGGPTGVEIAGALAELRKNILPKDYPTVDFKEMNIRLIEGLDRLLPGMSINSAKMSFKYLKKMKVEINLNTLVKDYDGRTVTLNNGDTFKAATLIWAAGVAGNIIEGIPDTAIEKTRIRVNRFNKILLDEKENKDENVFVIGDLAMMKTEQYPNGHPGVAQTAIQQGKHLAANFRNIQKNKKLIPFRYRDKGSLATIGRNKAVADIGIMRFQGFIGWIIWIAVHLLFLIGFRNKLVVLTNWLWNYFKYDKGIRLIIRPYVKDNDPVTKKLELEKSE